MPVADIEIGKLLKSDPNYGFHILKAYVAAQQNSKPNAEAELKSALAGKTGTATDGAVSVVMGEPPQKQADGCGASECGRARWDRAWVRRYGNGRRGSHA